MLQIRCPDHYERVLEFARSRGLLEQLESKLNYLRSYGGDIDAIRCNLFKDFAPYSFAFTIERKMPDGDFLFQFNGGLIYFGAGDSGVGMPQLSVKIGDLDEGWSIHT